MPSVRVAERPYEGRFFSALNEYGAAADQENRKKLARFYLEDVEQFAVVFDKALANEPATTRWLKITQWFIANRGLSNDIIERIKDDVE